MHSGTHATMGEQALSTTRFRIGYALEQKNQYSFIQPSLVDLTSQRGIDLIPIDVEKPLTSQGPFDLVIHKMPGEDWKTKIKDYAAAPNPETLVVDHPDDIERLHNRISMLDVVAEMEMEMLLMDTNASTTQSSFGIPKQVVIYDTEMLMDSNAFPDGLNFPVIAKASVVDGSAKSHKMSLVFNREGLSKLKPPIVLQEFVNHGGVLFKVYVVGDYVRCVKRNSLPDVLPEEKLACSRLESSMSFSQISNLPSQDRNYSTSELLEEEAEMPPSRLIDEIAVGLRKATKLHLFNFDVIRDARVVNRYLVIDINYFPGYAKMPEYETVFTDFFCNLLSKKDKDLTK